MTYQASISLLARVELVGRAREFVMATLGADHPCAEVLQLVVSELVTNSIVHSRSGLRDDGTVTLAMSGNSRRVRVAVTDQGGPTLPRLREVDFCLESGRGLYMVDALAAAWNCSRDPSGTTTTWAEVAA
jgi:anti-sigma regulatory factor (Ser/Thr protein kinase)